MFVMTEQTQSLLLFLGAGLVWLVVIEASVRARARQRLVDDLPTCKAHGVFLGLVELKGTAESEHPFTSTLAEVACVYYHASVQEHWRRTVTEVSRDSKGRSRVQTKVKTGWQEVASAREAGRFFLKDDTGAVRINPEDAKLEADLVFQEEASPADALYYAKGPADAIANSTHRRRFTEYAIPLHTHIYVMGKAKLRDDAVAPEVAADPDTPVFRISTKTEEEVSRGYAIAFWLLLLIGGALASATPLIHDAVLFDHAIPDIAMLHATLVFLGLFTARWSMMAFNSLTALKNRADQAWHNIDVELKRRANLIPAITEITQSLAEHNQDLLQAITTIRSNATKFTEDEAQPIAEQLRVVGEDYPELKANNQFQTLARAITDTEDRIAFARGYYNDVLAEHNERIERVPDRFIAPLAGMRHRAFFAVDAFIREAPHLELAE